jgi:hypothetical protein
MESHADVELPSDACARGCAEWSFGALAGHLHASPHEVASIIMYTK